MGQIAEMVFESRKPSDDLALDPERRHPIGNALLGFGKDVEDGPAQRLQGAALRLLQRR